MLKLFTILTALFIATRATPTSLSTGNEELDKWLASTDATMTYIGDSTLSPLTTTVIYCSSRVDNVCGGACITYTGGPKCLDAHDTQCLFATNNVGFCSSSGCKDKCNQFSTCGVRLDNGFCATPATKSILVGNA